MTEIAIEGAADPSAPAPVGRVLVLGATGTAGCATAPVLLRRGHDVVCFVRPHHTAGASPAQAARLSSLKGADIRFGEVTDPSSLARDGFRGERFDAVVSCMASRTGAPADAWAIDHRAHFHVLEAAQGAGVGHFVLSALCVQKPRLAFQHAKLAFQDALRVSGMRYSIASRSAAPARRSRHDSRASACSLSSAGRRGSEAYPSACWMRS